MNNENNSKPSGLVLPAGVRSPSEKPAEVFGVIVPSHGWHALVEFPADVKLPQHVLDEHGCFLSIVAWAQIRRGENSAILGEVLTVGLGQQQMNLTLSCPVLPLEAMVFFDGAVVSLRSVLERYNGKLNQIAKD